MKYVYMRTTTDELELPVAIADTARELAEMIGTSVNCVFSSLSHNHKGWAKVEIEEDENEL